MRHLWTTATTQDTVTHDAGEPEWLDLPVQGFVIEGDLPDERPVVKALDPPWHVLTCWQMELEDVGMDLDAVLRFKDPFGIQLFASPLDPESVADVLSTYEFSPIPVILSFELDEIGYTFNGIYRLSIEWSGSFATRDVGEFSLYIAHYGD